MPQNFNRRNGTPIAFDTPRRAVEQQSRQKLDYLSGQIEQPLMRQAMNFANAVPALRQGLQNDPPEVQAEMEAIVSGLLDPRPAFGEPPTESLNRYLDWHTVTNKNGEEVYVYRVKPETVKHDLAFLTKLQGIHPELAAPLEDVKRSLNDYARRDERMVAHDLGQRKRESFTNKAVGKVGMTAGLIGFSFAAVVTGGIMLANMWREKSIWKGFSIAPFLFGGLAVLCGSSSARASLAGSSILRDTPLGSGSEGTLKNLDRVINRSSLNTLLRQYGMQGPRWAEAVESFMNPDPLRDDILAKTAAGTATGQDIADYAASVSADPRIQASIAAMVRNGHLLQMTRTLSHASTAEERSVIVDYVKTGAWAYSK